MSYRSRATFIPLVRILASVSGHEGEIVYVNSIRCPWRYVASGSQFVADHITVEATADGGSSRWVREDYSHPIWRNGVADVYIDSVNGDDENQGVYYTAIPPISPAPLRTAQELRRRWGYRQVVTSAGAHDWSDDSHMVTNVLA